MTIGSTGLRLQARLSVAEGDDTYMTMRRLTRGGEKVGTGLRRALLRYAQIMEATDSPSPQVVLELHEILATHRNDLLNRMEYPAKGEVLETIKGSTSPERKRKALHAEVDGLSFAEYAKLMEAVELMLSRSL